jgi:hypothetical protein
MFQKNLKSVMHFFFNKSNSIKSWDVSENIEKHQRNILGICKNDLSIPDKNLKKV